MKLEDDLKKRKTVDDLKNKTKKWKTNQSTKINLNGCDTIVNSPSLHIFIKCMHIAHQLYFNLSVQWVREDCDVQQ